MVLTVVITSRGPKSRPATMALTRPRRLSASFVRTVNRPGRYGDGHGGHGLSLLCEAARPTAAGRSHGANGSASTASPATSGSARSRSSLWSKRGKLRLRTHAPSTRAATRGCVPPPPTFDKAAEIVIEMRAGTWRNPLTVRCLAFIVPPVGLARDRGKTDQRTLPAPMCSPCLRPIWNDGRQRDRTAAAASDRRGDAVGDRGRSSDRQSGR